MLRLVNAGFGEELSKRGLDAVRPLALDQRSGIVAGDDDEVELWRKAVGQGPEGLANRSLYRVSLDCAAHFAAHGQAETDVLRLFFGRPGFGVVRAGEGVEDEEAVRVRAALAIHAVEVAAPGEAPTLAIGGHAQGVRRFRPFARRRRITSRPERVRIRPRKPCVFARLRFFGCQVRFMVRCAPLDPEAKSCLGGSGRV